MTIVKFAAVTLDIDLGIKQVFKGAREDCFMSIFPTSIVYKGLAGGYQNRYSLKF